MIEIGARSFSLRDQVEFAELSGDSNPVHVDPAAARRTLFGSPVVHGVAGVLWALDRYLEHSGRTGVASIDARFVRSANLDKLIRCVIESEDTERCALRLEHEDGVVSRIDVTVAPHVSGDVALSTPEPQACRDRRFDSAHDAAGALPLFLDHSLALRLLPVLSRRLPGAQLASLLATTRLVGMELPGLHSIFTRLRVTMDAPSGEASLRWRVTVADPRFSSVRMNVEGPGMSGEVQAFFRPAPRAQPLLEDIAAQVAAGEFSRQRALVVGGSRGIGEVAAKAIVAGGGEVCITYLVGEADARRVCDALGSRATSVRFDAGVDELPALPWLPTHLYFFATPFIGGGRSGDFSGEKFDRFAQVYVTGFARAVTALARVNPTVSVLYPSTVFLDDPDAGFPEYCAAKAAGERVCTQLRSAFRSINVQAPRLPKVATDQTAGLRADQTIEPLAALLPLIRELC